MHLPPNPPSERNFAKVRFGLILIGTAGAVFLLFVSSNSGSLRVDASDKAERDRQFSSLLKEREKFQQELQPKKEEIKSEPSPSPEPPQEIFANLQPVPRLNLQETVPLNLSEIGSDSQTNISPVDRAVDEESVPVDKSDRLDLATDFVTDLTDELTDLAADFETDETDELTDLAADETESLPVEKTTRITGILPVAENPEIQPTEKETNPLEYWNLPPRNSATQLLASGRKTESKKTENTEEVLETSAENQQDAGIIITLNDAILLALENNRNLKNQYLARIIQRNELEIAEDIFAPDFTPEASLAIDGSDTNLLPFPNSGGLDLSADVVLRLPNGANISLNWQTTSRLGSDDNALNSIGQNLGLTVTQPLLRGAGTEINTLSIKSARLQEKINILELKSSLISTVTEVISTYRGLVQSQQGLEIQEKALEDAKERLEDTNFLIEIGRVARVEAVSIQQEIAGAELAVLRARGGLASQKLSLAQILDIERQIEVVAEDILEVETPSLNLEEVTELALLNQPSYLQQQIAIKFAEFALLQAEDNLRLQLDLRASYNNAASTLNNSTTGDFRAGISLRQEFGDMKERKLELKRSQIGLVQAQNSLLEARQSLEIQVANAVRNVNISLQEVTLATQATELARQELENEQAKLRFGVGSVRAKDVVEAQEDVVSARNAELDAKINYLNSLTNLSATLGTTLEELGIEFDDRLPEVVFEED